MKCLYCKGENPKGRTICISCGGPLEADTETGEKTDDIVYDVQTYLIPSIIALVFCQPFGLIAFTYSLKVIVFINNKQYDDAKRVSLLAKRWCWITLTIGIFLFVACIILYVLSFFGIAILSVILGSIE
jgi:Interferon-induced transmembrane protein